MQKLCESLTLSQCLPISAMNDQCLIISWVKILMIIITIVRAKILKTIAKCYYIIHIQETSMNDGKHLYQIDLLLYY